MAIKLDFRQMDFHQAFGAGRNVVYAAGVLGSASALYGFAVKIGGWPAETGWLLPLSLDVYWITALGVAMKSSLSTGSRVKATLHAVIAIGLSITGNMVFHELTAGDMRVSHFTAQVLVASAAAIPVLAAAALTHLTVLAKIPEPVLGAVEEPGSPAEPGPGAVQNQNRDASAAGYPVPEPVEDRQSELGTGNREAAVPESQETGEDRTRYRGPRDLSALTEAARPLALAYYREHGKHITAADLRMRLATAKSTACDVLRILKPEIEAADAAAGQAV